MMAYKKLSNGVEMPVVGLGTWKILDRNKVSFLINKAFEEGYRLFDTAAAYSNESSIGRVIDAMADRRRDVFLSDKVWNTYRGYDKVREACKRSLKKLKTDYMDLYLIHWPASVKLYDNWAEINADTWRGMESLYEDGAVRAIGVCNFEIHHLEELRKTARILPMINQFEFHPGLRQEELIVYCRSHEIVMEASSPLGNGQVLNHPILGRIAEKHEKTAAQICLRYALEQGLVVIPKTEHEERLKENMDVFDFSLSKEEIKTIDTMPYCGGCIVIDS